MTESIGNTGGGFDPDNPFGNPTGGGVESGFENDFSGDFGTNLRQLLAQSQFNQFNQGFNQQLGGFNESLSQLNPAFLDAANFFQGVATGDDPFLEAELGTLRGQTSEFFGRRGSGGSGAELNALNRGARQAQLNSFGRRSDARLQSLEAIRAFLENQQIPLSLLLQQNASNTAART